MRPRTIYALCAVISGSLLACAFPPFEWAEMAWIALMPLIWMAVTCPPREAFTWGWLSGSVFFLASLSWLSRVSSLAWVAVAVYCGAYWALFATTTSWWARRRRELHRRDTFLPLLVIPALWVGFEYARATWLTGFPWNALGISQFGRPLMIQLAEWGGVPAVSFVIVAVNVGLVWLKETGADRKRQVKILAAVLLLLGLNAAYGAWVLQRPVTQTRPLKVLIVQPNIPQYQKWSPEWGAFILNRMRETSIREIQAGRPDLVVWPESVLPDFFRSDPASRKVVEEVLAQGVPVLVGSMDYVKLDDEERFYNSSLLFVPGTRHLQIYNKRHLVVLGEYVPFQRYLPFIQALTPIEGSFTPGVTNTVFQLPGSAVTLSALICIEDIFSDLGRASVRNGARLLINQTNDGWYDPSVCSRQHMSHCVFRCVENRVPAVRVTNTGVSCFIDEKGQMQACLPIASGSSPEPATALRTVQVPQSERPSTFYTRQGELLGLGCLALAACLLLASLCACLRRPSGK